ncbi:hypothetical protein SESBI_31108 [Sesbania bispinosa]|nr:hypothetical protein SESBI_31108 [Sesbania bispinosa]
MRFSLQACSLLFAPRGCFCSPLPLFAAAVKTKRVMTEKEKMGNGEREERGEAMAVEGEEAALSSGAQN